MVRDVNATLRVARTVVFSLAILSASIVLARSASIIFFLSQDYYNNYRQWFLYQTTILAIATGALTLLTLPPMLFLSLKRKGAMSSMIAVELGWTLILLVLWLATEVHTALGRFSIVAITFTSFTCFLLLLYNITLLVLLIKQHKRGNTFVWKGYITETDFAAAGPDPTSTPTKIDEEQFTAQYHAPAAVPVLPAQQQVFVHPITPPYPQV